MTGVVELFPSEESILDFTGERYLPNVRGKIQYEHHHRYIYALQFVCGKRVLDIACGEGYGTYCLSKAAKSVIGVDVSGEVIRCAETKYKADNVQFSVGDIRSIPVSDHSVDVVVCFETIEHLADQSKAFSEFQRVLSSGGILVISSPDAEANDGEKHELNPFHFRELKRDGLAEVLNSMFTNVYISYQRYVHGSVIVSQQSLRSSFRSAVSKDMKSYEIDDAGIRSSYLLAIGSNAELEVPAVDLMDAQSDLRRWEDDFKYAVGRMHQLEREMGEATVSASERDGVYLERERALMSQLQVAGDMLEVRECNLHNTVKKCEELEKEVKLLKAYNEIKSIQIARLRKGVQS